MTHEQFVVKNPKTGEVKFSQYYRGTLSMVNMSLTHFPFDVQNLRICVRPHKMTIDEVELEPADDHAIEHHSRHEWKVVGHCTHIYATNPARSTKRGSAAGDCQSARCSQDGNADSSGAAAPLD